MNINKRCVHLKNLVSRTRALTVALTFMITAALAGTSVAHAQTEPLTHRLVGDVGGAVYATQTVIRSKPNLAEFKLGRASIFPQVGFEHRSAKYSNYLYGVTTAESITSGSAAYNAGASTTPILGVGMDVPLAESQWFINLQLRRKWLSSWVYNSSLVARKTQDFGLLALSYRFK